MSTTVDARCNGDIVLKGDLRDAAASETAISLEVSSLASFFEEFFFDDEGGNDNDNDDLRIHVQSCRTLNEAGVWGRYSCQLFVSEFRCQRQHHLRPARSCWS